MKQRSIVMKQVVTLAAGAALMASTQGCVVEAGSESDELDVATVEQALVNGNHYAIFAFNGGNWRRSVYAWPATTSPTVTTGSFGVSTDLPFIWDDSTTSALSKIGTYGKVGDRLGYFYFDQNGSMSWNAGDVAVKFRSDAQSGDKPFVVTAQLWGRNSSGQCVARVSGGSPVTGRMIGIKRGTAVYLDRDGDGVWAGANHCDLSGTIGLSGDDPTGVPSVSSTSGGHVFALTRVVGTQVMWMYDNNLNLAWNVPPDWASPLNAFGDALQYFPFSHPDCIATQSGTSVFHDINCNGVWDGGDTAYNSALPSSSWKLAGVDGYWTHP